MPKIEPPPYNRHLAKHPIEFSATQPNDPEKIFTSPIIHSRVVNESTEA